MLSEQIASYLEQEGQLVNRQHEPGGLFFFAWAETGRKATTLTLQVSGSDAARKIAWIARSRAELPEAHLRQVERLLNRINLESLIGHLEFARRPDERRTVQARIGLSLAEGQLTAGMLFANCQAVMNLLDTWHTGILAVSEGRQTPGFAFDASLRRLGYP